jgi:hypothetical protein
MFHIFTAKFRESFAKYALIGIPAWAIYRDTRVNITNNTTSNKSRDLGK